MSKRISILGAATMLLTVAGCGERSYPVSGTVTFEGQPVETGTIAFEAADGGPGVASAGIEKGKYALVSKVGKKKVMITAYRPRPGATGPQPAMEDFIPAKYNSQTTLKAEFKAEENRFNFDLKK